MRAWEERCPSSKQRLVFPVDGEMGKTTDMLGLGKLMEATDVQVPEREWHALRHTFASQFMMAGGNILTLQKLLGHSSVQMTMIYAHLAPDFMASELGRLEFPAPTQADIDELAEARRAEQAALYTQSQSADYEADRSAADAS